MPFEKYLQEYVHVINIDLITVFTNTIYNYTYTTRNWLSSFLSKFKKKKQFNLKQEKTWTSDIRNRSTLWFSFCFLKAFNLPISVSVINTKKTKTKKLLNH